MGVAKGDTFLLVTEGQGERKGTEEERLSLRVKEKEIERARERAIAKEVLREEIGRANEDFLFNDTVVTIQPFADNRCNVTEKSQI